MKVPSERQIETRPLTSEFFAEYGDIVERGDRFQFINDGACKRYNDLARLDFDSHGRIGISLFEAEIRTLPYELTMMERHPRGSQAFLPLSTASLLVIVASDIGGTPGVPEAFESLPHQGVNIHRDVWHGVLTPLSGSGLFAVVDWVGSYANLETHQFRQAFVVNRGQSIGGTENS